MGVRFRKSIHLPGGIRVNLSKSGIGCSYGVKGFRVAHTARGTTRTTVSIPGTGISYVEESNSAKSNVQKKGNLADKLLPASLVFLAISALVFLFASFRSCGSSGSTKEPDTPPVLISSDPAQTPSESQEPEEEPSEVAEKILLEYLDMEMVDFQRTNMGYQISIELPGISDRENQDSAPDDWEATQRLIISAAAHIRDEFNYSNGIIAVSVLDSCGNTMVTVQNGRILNDIYYIPPEPTSNPDDNTIVWISDTGKRYHRDPDCSGIKNPSAVRRGYAVSHGYTACSRCY